MNHEVCIHILQLAAYGHAGDPIAGIGLWIVGSWGFSTPYFSSGMKVALKNWARVDSFPIHRLSLNILRQVWAQRTASPISSEGIK